MITGRKIRVGDNVTKKHRLQNNRWIRFLLEKLAVAIGHFYRENLTNSISQKFRSELIRDSLSR